jgi:hypothetical protein
MRTNLHRVLLGMNASIRLMSKKNNYYPPKINLDKNQSVSSIIKEFEKMEIFLRAPELSYLSKYKKKVYE